MNEYNKDGETGVLPCLNVASISLLCIEKAIIVIPQSHLLFIHHKKAIQYLVIRCILESFVWINKNIKTKSQTLIERPHRQQNITK